MKKGKVYRVIVTDICYCVEKRGNVFAKNFVFSHYEVPGRRKVKYKSTKSIPVTKIAALPIYRILKGFESDGSDGWEYGTLTGWSYQTALVARSRRRRYVRVYLSLTTKDHFPAKFMKKHRNILSVSVLDSKLAPRVSLQTHFDRSRKFFRDNRHKKIKPVILIIGGSGSGKSSLVNAIFGQPLAKIGAGRPVTQCYTCYNSPESPVAIYDSKGIEHGEVQIDQFRKDTDEFFHALTSRNSIDDHVHLVWYVIDLTQTRFQPFEAEFCRKELQHYPILFVFNKKDAVRPDVMETMVNTVKNFKIPNAIGYISTVADRKNFDSSQCPSCGSGKIRKRIKKGECTVLCKECKAKNHLTRTEGLVQLKELSVKNVPRLVEDAVTETLRFRSVDLPENQVRNVIFAGMQRTQFTMPHKAEGWVQHVHGLVGQILKIYELESFQSLFMDKIGHLIRLRYKGYSGTVRRLQSLGQLVTFRNIAFSHFYAMCIGLWVANCCVVIRYNISKYGVDIEKQKSEEEEESKEEEEEEEIEGEDKEEDDEKKTKQKKTKKKKEKERDEEVMFEECMFRHVSFRVDSEYVKKVSEEMKNYYDDDVMAYLTKIKINGKFQLIPKRKEKKIEGEEFEILTTYQRKKNNKKNGKKKKKNKKKQKKGKKKEEEENEGEEEEEEKEKEKKKEKTKSEEGEKKKEVKKKE